jgi:hypothetical protein
MKYVSSVTAYLKTMCFHIFKYDITSRADILNYAT